MANNCRLIDANALLQFVDERKCGLWIYKHDFVWAVTKQPTVDAVEVVHGEWGEIYTCHDERLWGYKCSRCEQDSAEKSNYCPNCGAKMDEERSANDLPKM